MQFLYPTFLFALAVLAIPIILHLFYFRRFKKVYFTNVRFLREVKEETSTRSKLRNLLVLLMRLLALAFLVLAFAQPFIPQDAEVKQGRISVSVFVDNSFSMDALSQDVPLLDKAKQRAREIVEAFSPEDEFQILTNDFEGRHQRLVSQEDALTLIEEIEVSPAVRELSRVIDRQRQAVGTGEAESEAVYLISDFQRNITDLQQYADTTLEVNLVPLQAVQERNISIDSAWFEAPVQPLNQNSPLIVRVRNLSDQAAENIRLTLRYERQAKPVGTLSIPPQSSVIDTVNLTVLRTGWHEAELEITDFPIQFDDHYYFTFWVAEKINVLVINEETPNRHLDAVFRGLPNFEVVNQQSRSLDYSTFSGYQLIVAQSLNDISSGLAFELQQYVAQGGNLLVFPGRNADLAAYRSFLASFPANELIRFEEEERQVGSINTEEFVFQDVYEEVQTNLKLPVTQGNFRLGNTGRGEEPLLLYRDGSPYLSKYQIEEGHLYLCAAPLNEDYNDLVRNGEIFVPMLYKMAISSARGRKIAYTIGRDEVIEDEHVSTSNEIVYKLKGEGEEFIPEQRIIGARVYLSIGNQARQAGFYDLFLNPEETLATYGFNYDRKESELAYFSPEDLAAYVGDNATVIDVRETAVLTGRIEERSRGVVLWRWCLILALVFLAAEVLLLRLWRV